MLELSFVGRLASKRVLTVCLPRSVRKEVQQIKNGHSHQHSSPGMGAATDNEPKKTPPSSGELRRPNSWSGSWGSFSESLRELFSCDKADADMPRGPSSSTSPPDGAPDLLPQAPGT